MSDPKNWESGFSVIGPEHGTTTPPWEWEVMEAECETCCKCTTEAAAKTICDALNKEYSVREGADRHSIVMYLRRMARVDIGTTLTKEQRETVDQCAWWVANQLDMNP